MNSVCQQPLMSTFHTVDIKGCLCLHGKNEKKKIKQMRSNLVYTPIWVCHLRNSQTTSTILHNEECYPLSYDTLDFLCLRWANQKVARGCEVLTNLYCENSLKIKTIQPHFILHGTALETRHNQHWHSTWFLLANDPCRICY